MHAGRRVKWCCDDRTNIPIIAIPVKEFNRLWSSHRWRQAGMMVASSQLSVLKAHRYGESACDLSNIIIFWYFLHMKSLWCRMKYKLILSGELLKSLIFCQVVIRILSPSCSETSPFLCWDMHPSPFFKIKI